jgi:hypothetical protein
MGRGYSGITGEYRGTRGNTGELGKYRVIEGNTWEYIGI